MTSVKPLNLVNSILPLHYDLQLELCPSKVNFRATEVIDFKPRTQGEGLLQRFELHSRDLVILSATLNDDIAVKVSYDKDNQLALFNVDQPVDVSTMERIQLTLKYIGKIKTIKTREDETSGVFKTNFMNQETGLSDNFVVATHCQPSYARSIFPCIDEPSWKTTFQLSIKTLQKYEVVSNVGQLSSVADENQDYKTVRFGVTPLMSTSVFGFVLGDLEHSTSQATMTHSSRRIPISVYSPLNIGDSIFCLDIVQKYLPLLEEYFEADYPLDKLDFVLLPFLTDMAMENFGMVFVQMNHLLLPPSMLADAKTREQVQQLVVHELVHQWMGNFISFESWEYLWFNEAFATWCACVLLEQTGDIPNYWTSSEYLQNQVENTMRIDAKIETLSVSAISKITTTSLSSQTHDFFDPHSYMKGIAILRSMQVCIGDELFRSALRKIFQESGFHGKPIKPIDIFVRMGVLLKSENIAHFFTSLCQTPGLPVVSVEIVKSESGITTRLTQHRLLTAKQKNLEDVPYHVPLFIQLPDGTIDQKNVLLTDRSTTLKYPIVVCNHDAQGFYRVSYESMECYDQINNEVALGKLSAIDLVKIFSDLSFFVEHGAKNIHMVGLYSLLKNLASNEMDLEKNKEYWAGLCEGLKILNLPKLKSLKYNCASSEILDFKAGVLKPLANKINRTNSKNPDPYQLEVLSQLKTLKKN